MSKLRLYYKYIAIMGLFPSSLVLSSSTDSIPMKSLHSLIRTLAVFSLLAVSSVFAGYRFTTLASSTVFDAPSSVTVDTSGNIYVADTNNEVVRKITPSGIVTTIAGLAGSSGNVDANGGNARFNFPHGLATDAAGNVYVADTGNNSIRKITPSGDVTTVAAGFNLPYGVAVDSAGSIYVANTNDQTVEKITASGVVSLVAGAASISGNVDSNVGTNARFNRPYGISVDVAGMIYIADSANHSVRKITPSGAVSTLAGSTAGAFGFVNGTGSAARFTFPHGVTVDSEGNVYVAEASNNSIRKITVDGIVTTFAGSSVSGNVDGIDAAVRFSGPNDVTVDQAGNFYISDTNNNRIRKGTPLNGITYNQTTFPTAAVVGATVNFSYNVTNAGSKTWGANHYLSMWTGSNNYVDIVSVAGVSSNGSTTANLSFVAPSTPGTYTYYVQAFENGVDFFGSQAVLTLTVATSLPNNISYNTTSFPTIAAPGSTVNFSYSVTNKGTKAWGANHYLSLRDSDLNYLSIVSIKGVNPNASKAVNLSFTAPVRPGTYTYYVQALDTGVGFFSTEAVLTLIVPAPNAVTYSKTTFPTEVQSGAEVNFSYDVTNTGTKAWGANHYLSLRDADNTYLSIVSIGGVAPNGSTTANLSFVAPSTPGTYTYYVQALEAGTEFFSTQATLTLTVKATLSNAMRVNTTNFPASAARGNLVNFYCNVTDTGTKAWGANHYLSLRDANNTYLSIVSIGGVAPNGSTTANLSFVAPSTPGTYTYYVQALEAGTEFFTTQETFVLIVP
jgi:sugar lactone lactonase YvrE